MVFVEKIRSVWRFYYEGFRNMTWGRILWVLILLKLFILFAILRVFFFRPVLEGKSEQEKSEFVGKRLENASDKTFRGLE